MLRHVQRKLEALLEHAHSLNTEIPEGTLCLARPAAKRFVVNAF